jgi:aspartate/methionine/tyrosine aminotransferase
MILLADETYRNVSKPGSQPVLAARFPNTVTVGSMSKAFGLAGIRIGWIVCADASLMESFLAAKEMIHITNPVLDEEIAYRFFLEKPRWMDQIHRRIKENYTVLECWLAEEKRVECIMPREGVVCFPRLTADLAPDAGKFYKVLEERYQTLVAPGHWFDMPDRYMRIGFGWMDATKLKEGLDNISRALDDAIS